MLPAFRAARVAEVGADAAHFLRETAAARHIAGGEATDRCAVDVEADAFRHHLHVWLSQARRRAMVASVGAEGAGFETGRVLGVHADSPSG